MKFKSRKASVFVVLALLVVIQIVFSGIDAERNDKTVVADNTAVNLAEASGNDTDSITEEEVVSANLNVVYRSTLTSTEVVDELEDNNIDNGDFDNKIVSYTCDRLCMYEQPDANSAVVGVMYSGSEADIVELGKEWTKVTSNGITGYIHNTDVLFGEEAETVASVIGNKTVKVSGNSVPVYADADTGSSQIAQVSDGESLDAYDEINGFLLVDANGEYGYISRNQVSVGYGLDTAISIEEEQERIEAERAAAAKKAAEEAAAAAAAAAKYANVTTTNRGAFNASEEEIHLLAAIIYWESGWEPAEGQLAVANVVLNRVQSSRFSQNTIAGVIYAAGQFAGVSENGGPSARFQAVLNKSNAELNTRGCYDAAVAAVSGQNNIGDLVFFISVKKANYARYSKYTIINNHCFYTY